MGVEMCLALFFFPHLCSVQADYHRQRDTSSPPFGSRPHSPLVKNESASRVFFSFSLKSIFRTPFLPEVDRGEEDGHRSFRSA